MTMFGTITTDGTIGPLLQKNIVAWRITARNQDISYMTKANSVVLAATGVAAGVNGITVDRPGASLLSAWAVGARRL